METYKYRSYTWVHREHVPFTTWLLGTHEYRLRRGHIGNTGGFAAPGNR